MFPSGLTIQLWGAGNDMFTGPPKALPLVPCYCPFEKRYAYSHPSLNMGLWYHPFTHERITTNPARETDPKKREQLYFRLQELAYQDVPTIYLIYRAACSINRSASGFLYPWALANDPVLCMNGTTKL